MAYLNESGLTYFWSKLKNKFVAKETGKGLSTNDYSNEQKQLVATTADNLGAHVADTNNPHKTPYHTPSYTSGLKIGTGSETKDLYVPTASGSAQGVTIVYPESQCTTYTSDSGTCTPAAVKKAVGMFVKQGTTDGTISVNGQNIAIPGFISYSAATTYTRDEINRLINGAPTTLDTLKEIADAMAENAEVVEALEEAIGSKAAKTDLDSHINNKSNPHAVTAAQVGLGNVENKSSATIRGELTKENVTTALGYTPPTTNTTYSAGTGVSISTSNVISNSGVRSIATGTTNGTISVNTNGTAANVAVKGLGSAAYTASTAYDAAGAADTALASAKTYADGKVSAIKYAGSSSAGGAATSANKINTDAGSTTQPVYFLNGIPVKTTYTLGASVPSGAKFTDTTYSEATTSAAGLMSASDKSKLDGITSGANKITVDSALSSTSTNPVQNKVINTALSGKVPTSRTVNGKALSSNITISASDIGLGKVENKTSAEIRGELTNEDIVVGLGYEPPRQDTTYSNATTSNSGLMSASDKTKLNGIATGATKNVVSLGTSQSASSTTFDSTEINDPYIKLIDNAVAKGAIQLVGGDNVTITRNTSGKIIISASVESSDQHGNIKAVESASGGWAFIVV